MLTGFPELEQELGRQIREASLDHLAFETLLKPCDLLKCRGMCCHDGVYLGEEEEAVLSEFTPENSLERREGRLKTRTVESEESQRGEGFPAHFPHTRCVFLDENHHCLLQAKAIAEERHPWFWKPFPCWLHPLTIIRDPRDHQRPHLTLPTLQCDPSRQESYPGFAPFTTCGKEQSKGRPAWEVLEEELVFLSQISGRNLFAELSGSRS